MKLILIVLITLNLYSLDLKPCDKVIKNSLYTACYSYKYKSVVYGYTSIKKKDIELNNIGKRPNFYTLKSIPKKYRRYSKDYNGIGIVYNRGHTIRSDASSDYGKRPLKLTYNMVNITPMYYYTNIVYWGKIEERGRYIATKCGNVKSETYVIYKRRNNKLKIIKKDLVIPNYFIRKYTNDIIEECYKVPNGPIKKYKSLSTFKMDCKKIDTYRLEDIL